MIASADVDKSDGEDQAEDEYEVDPDRENADEETIAAVVEEVQEKSKYKVSVDEERTCKFAVTKVSNDCDHGYRLLSQTP